MPYPEPWITDFFTTTLASPVGAGVVTATLTSVTNGQATPQTIATEGYLYLDGASSASGLNELVYYTTLNVGAKTVLLAQRGLGGTSDQAHAAGAPVEQVVAGGYLNKVLTLLQNTATGHTHDGTDSKKVVLSAPNPIGSVTPNTGAFTTLSATGVATFTGNVIVNSFGGLSSNSISLSGAMTGTGYISIDQYLEAGAYAKAPLVVITGAASAVAGGSIGLGSSTQATVGAAGAAAALPGAPLGYWISYLGATKIVIPYWAAA